MRGKPITFKGVTYPSLTNLANTFQINPSTLRIMLSDGYTLDEVLNAKPNSRSVEYRGVTYKNLKHLSLALNIDYNRLKNRLKNCSLEESVNDLLSKI